MTISPIISGESGLSARFKINQGFTQLGIWSNASSYIVDDLVSYQGIVYRCIIANSGVAPEGSTEWTKGDNFEVSFIGVSNVTVNHFLKKTPSITVIDTAGTEFVVDVNHLNNNTLVASWNGSTSGKIICN